MTSEWFDDLQGLDKAFEAGKKKAQTESRYVEVPDGIVTANVTNCYITRSQRSNRLQIVWFFTLDKDNAAELAGQTVRDYTGLEPSQDQEMSEVVKHLNWRLEDLGVDYSKAKPFSKKLPAILEKIKEERPKVRIELRTRNNFQNIFIQELLDEEGEEYLEEEEEYEEEEYEPEEGEEEYEEEEYEEEEGDEEEEDDTEDEEETEEDEDEGEEEEDDEWEEPEDEEEEEGDEEEEWFPKKGEVVSWEDENGDTKEGTIVQSSPTKEQVRVRIKRTKKVVTVDFGDLEYISG